jgi:hypothetical protein
VRRRCDSKTERGEQCNLELGHMGMHSGVAEGAQSIVWLGGVVFYADDRRGGDRDRAERARLQGQEVAAAKAAVAKAVANARGAHHRRATATWIRELTLSDLHSRARMAKHLEVEDAYGIVAAAADEWAGRNRGGP